MRHSAYPFADLSVDEDQVIQGQDYLCWSTATATAKAEPNLTISPGETENTTKMSLKTHTTVYVCEVS